MIFKIQLAVPNGLSLKLFSVLLVIFPDYTQGVFQGFYLGFRYPWQTIHQPSFKFNILARRTAAAIAPTVAHNNGIREILLLKTVPRPQNVHRRNWCRIGRIRMIVYTVSRITFAGRQEICKNLTPVNTTPHERVVGHAVGIIPADFRRNEIL